jgi:glutamyl-tRNA synthetase
MAVPNPPVITRFAPSPTGHLHVGGVRTALFCWAFARRYNGHFTLRIEDTDQARSSESSARGILDDLAWCGILWDEGPELALSQGGKTGGDPRHCVGSYYQSQRLDLYNRVIEDMLARDLAYPAFDTPAEMEAMRKAASERKETFRYKRPGIYNRSEAMARMKAGQSCVIRFNNPGSVIKVSDEVLGEIKFEPEHTDDFIIRKADGFPTYHFAVVVDDEQMGVTHILRGQEHLNNTPRHTALQRALGYRTPAYAHLPLIFNPDGSKMSKRDKDKAAREACRKAGIATLAQAFAGAGAQADIPRVVTDAGVTEAVFSQWLDDKSRQLPSDALRALAKRLRIVLPEIDVDDFRRAGYLPEVLCNYMALLGWNPGMKNPDGTDLEKFDMEFLAKNFTLERIGKTNSKFDRVKLAAFNQAALAAMSDAEFVRHFREWCSAYEPELLRRFSEQQVQWLCQAAKPRVKTIAEVASALGPVAFAFVPDDGYEFDKTAAEKSLAKAIDGASGADGASTTGAALLREFVTEIETIEPFAPEQIEAAFKSFVDRRVPGKMGALAQPIRVAVTGNTVSPPIGQTLAVLGRAAVLARIGRCLERA